MDGESIDNGDEMNLSDSEDILVDDDSSTINSNRSEVGDSAPATWSPVWKFFKRYVDDKKSMRAKCQVKNSKGKECKEDLKGWITTNAYRHLRSRGRECNLHKKAADAVESELKAIKEARKAKKNSAEKMDSMQTKLSFAASAKYHPSHQRQTETTRKWATAFVVNSWAYRGIESKEVRDAMNFMDSKYDIPSAYVLRKDVDLMFSNMEKNVSSSKIASAKISYACCSKN